MRVGSTLAAPGGVYRAKCITIITFAVSLVLISCATWILYFNRYKFYSFFTYDDEVIEGLDRIWFHVCLYNILLSQYGVLNGVVVGLGKQWYVDVSVKETFLFDNCFTHIFLIHAFIFFTGLAQWCRS